MSDADNPYSAPTSDVTVKRADLSKFYNPWHVALATLLGTLAAGTWLLAENYRATNKLSERRIALGLGGTIAAIQILLPVVFPRQVPSLALSIGAVVGIYMYAKEMQLPFIEMQCKSGAEIYPSWRAIGIGLLFFIVLTAILSVILYLIGA